MYNPVTVEKRSCMSVFGKTDSIKVVAGSATTNTQVHHTQV